MGVEMRMEQSHGRGASVALPAIQDAITIPQDAVSMRMTSDSAAMQVRRIALPQSFGNGTLVSISQESEKGASLNSRSDLPTLLDLYPYS